MAVFGWLASEYNLFFSCYKDFWARDLKKWLGFPSKGGLVTLCWEPAYHLLTLSLGTCHSSAIHSAGCTCRNPPGLSEPGRCVQLKEETDRAGLHLSPGCKHQATHMVTLPMDSELCARCLQKRPTNGERDPWIKEPQDLDLDSPLPKRICQLSL